MSGAVGRAAVPRGTVRLWLLAARPRAHELVPRLVEALPAGRLRSISVRPPNLADVFVRVTGHALAEAA